MKSSSSAGTAQSATRLTLFVAGESARSRHAVDNLYRLLDSWRGGPVDLEVVDVLENPELAERERILATPTLLKDAPPPRRRIIGDLSDVDQVLRMVAPHVVGGSGVSTRAIESPDVP